MRTLAVLPIKRFDAAKQRLSEVLGAGSRQALAQAMCLDVLASLRRVPQLEGIVVVTVDPVAEASARSHRVPVLHDRQEGQSAAARTGLRHAAAEGFERVLLVPGDTPLVSAPELSEMLDQAERDELAVVIVPDRHGRGTNALLLTPPLGFEPRFGEGSLERHLRQARDQELRHRVDPLEGLIRDVDTPEDLAELWSALDDRRGLAPLTRGALRQLDRSRVYGSAAMAEVRDRLRAEDQPAWLSPS